MAEPAVWMFPWEDSDRKALGGTSAPEPHSLAYTLLPSPPSHQNPGAKLTPEIKHPESRAGRLLVQCGRDVSPPHSQFDSFLHSSRDTCGASLMPERHGRWRNKPALLVPSWGETPGSPRLFQRVKKQKVESRQTHSLRSFTWENEEINKPVN